MSLDIYLTTDNERRAFMLVAADALEESGRQEFAAGVREIAADAAFDDQCVFESNITHNLGRMAEEAGFYHAVWRPEENGIERAGQIVEPLVRGIQLMKADPQRFRPLSAENNWGTYEQFLPWCVELLDACKKYPQAKVWASR